jgi:hypothetical protein
MAQKLAAGARAKAAEDHRRLEKLQTQKNDPRVVLEASPSGQ